MYKDVSAFLHMTDKHLEVGMTQKRESLVGHTSSKVSLMVFSVQVDIKDDFCG